MPFILRSDAGIMLIFHLQSGIWEFHFPFTCNLYGKCFGISVTHLTSDLEVPGSSPGVSNNFFSSLFFLFDLSLYHLLWIIKTHTIANNVINNHIFIITLLSLDPLLFACNPYGRWLFLKSGFYILVFCEQFCRYFGLIFVDFWVCCSWDYILSKCSLILFRCHHGLLMIIINITMIHHHHRHVIRSFSLFISVFISQLFYHKTWRQTTLFVLVTI